MKRAIRREELREIVPLADSTIYELEKKGDFPARFYLTPRTVAWDLDEVQDWLAKRKAAGAELQGDEHKPDVRQRKARPVKQALRVVNG